MSLLKHEFRACSEALRPVLWLMGKWKSVEAAGQYPTIDPFNYCEELTFESLGQPILNYISRTWHPEKGQPMHLESGFLHVNPGTTEVAFVAANSLGLATVEEGSVKDKCLKLKSVHIHGMSFVAAPMVLEIERSYRLCNGQLRLNVSMATTMTPLCEHLSATYEKFG